jgi:SAM-dependent methyltransferase
MDKETNKIELKDGVSYLEYKEANHSCYKNSDLVPAIYEGGYKLWECSLDILNYIQTGINFNGLSVLEIGCGIGLPGLYCLLQGAHVVFQDFNEDVIVNSTSPTVMNNLKRLGKEHLSSHAKFIYGDWKGISVDKADIILTSDTIYNEKNYDSLVYLMGNSLKPSGQIILGCKRFYFGVGGGVNQFKDYLKKQGGLKLANEIKISDGMSNIREILILTN